MKILRIKEVTEKTSMCRSQIYQLMDTGEFPQSVRLGPRSVGWVDTEVDNWIKSRITERDTPHGTEQTTTVS